MNRPLEPASRESLGIWGELNDEDALHFDRWANDIRLGDLIVGILRRQFIFPSVLICQQGFRYHYAEPSYLMLAKWIAETFDTLPANASHRVGIGAFVMNDMGEVLVVQENSGTFIGTGVWKAPTGVVDEVALLASCVRWGLKVLSAMGAGT
ncbi:hypothetical protein RHMOL_Rhmol07G0061100 [Rhododendron molle]|nr:hypothetical protein RHMOL_Rhmol07G0061100 [Rhododendron molle]